MTRSILQTLKARLRPAKNLAFALGGFVYDYLRYLRYAGWWRSLDPAKRDYRAVKTYHRLEKSLSFRERRAGAGWPVARDLRAALAQSEAADRPFGFQERVALTVLDRFAASSAGEGANAEVDETLAFTRGRAGLATEEGGTIRLSSAALAAGRLDDPERFFLTRHSVRDFDPARAVDGETIRRAVRLAQRSPSVCNRQAWHVYHLRERAGIDRALSFQNGNRGFGHEVPALLIVTGDLRAFDSAEERYQHWIDGGMFAMSVVWALHALGLAACCLNWSKGPLDDMRFRQSLRIDPAQTVMMMIAVGHPRDQLAVCSSARRPFDEIYTPLD